MVDRKTPPTLNPKNPLLLALYHLFMPMGRSSRRTFWITLAGFAALVVAFEWGLSQHDNTGAFFFWGFLIWMVMLVQGVFGIYGKRLKDFGRSVLWILTLIALILVVLVVIMLNYGGAEYFAAYVEYDRKSVIDPAVREALDAEFQAEMARTGPAVSLITGGLMLAFTAWVGLTPGDEGTNKYGPPPPN